MAKIRGVEGLGDAELNKLISEGGRFVVFSYTISVLIMTFRRSTDIYFLRPGESAFSRALPWTALTLVGGWWGIPWGPIYSIMSLVQNLGGGKDVTAVILGQAAPEEGC